MPADQPMTPTPQERAELIVNGLLHRPDDLQGNLQFVEQAIADATAAAEAEAKQALAHIRKLETNDTENQAAFERVQTRIRDLEGELERLRGELKLWKPLTREEAEAALDAAKGMPMSEERINEIVAFVTDPANTLDNSQQAQLVAEIERLRGERRVSVQCHCGVTYTPTCPGCGMEIARLADAGGE